MKSNLEDAMRCPKWAVVGASENPARVSNEIQEILMERGYAVYPVSPKLDVCLGLKCYPSVSDLPERPDVVDMVVNPGIGIGVMEEIERAGIERVWLQPGSESDEIREFARVRGLILIEDCILARLRRRPDFRIASTKSRRDD